ncbi:transcriptional regulator [Neorhodopirellula pilleata]|nr:transcriptional regulator [Neorhodopirellula pilleata]
MNSNPRSISLPVVAAADYRHAVPGEMWELSPASIVGPISYRSEPRDNSSASVAKLATSSLATPVDFPSIDAAILDGDHVALAVDPNVPQVGDVIEGVIEALSGCQAGRISIVLWPETSAMVVESLKTRFQNVDPDASDVSPPSGGPAVTVIRHEPQMRSLMRYVAADADAEAIYLSRDLVDADFAIPIVAARAADAIGRLDKTGVFPMFADSSTTRRYQGGILPTFTGGDDTIDEDVESASEPQSNASVTASNAAVNEVGFLLGIQLMIVVSSKVDGLVGRILAGTPDAIRHELETLHAVVETETSPKAGLVIAALDGDATAQTWANVARAAIAAAEHTEGEGMIVIWSRIDHAPNEVWQSELGPDDWESTPRSVDEFNDWHGERVLARRLAMLLSDHRILLHSELASADVEALGVGVIGSVEELRKLGESFQGAGVIRAAQFHAASVARLTQYDDQDS